MTTKSPTIFFPSRRNFKDLLRMSLPSTPETKMTPSFSDISSFNPIPLEVQAQNIIKQLISMGRVLDPPSGSSTLDLLTKSKKNGFIACSNTTIESDLYISLVMFPKPEHVPTYYLAGSKSLRDGPADSYPGSIGILDIEIDLRKSKGRLVQLQSSVRHSHPEVKNLLKRSLNQPQLATYYAHWKHDLMQIGLDYLACLLYTSPSPRDQRGSRMPSSA